MPESISPHHHYDFRLRDPIEVAEIIHEFRSEQMLQELCRFTPEEWDRIEEKAEMTAYNLENAPLSHLDQPKDLDPIEAKAMFHDLHHWNRSRHDKIILKFEAPFCRLAERLVDKALSQPELLRDISRKVTIDEVPYSVASLPPNLFDIDGSGGVYLPKNYYDAAYLAHTTEQHLFKLSIHFGTWSLGMEHDELGHLKAASQVAFELRRRMLEGDSTFSMEKGIQDWKAYRKLFDKHLKVGNLSLVENAAFMSYQKNRTSTAASGFFEQLTEEFDSFMLTNIVTGSYFTSQLRVPIGAYGRNFSTKLIRAATVMSLLIQEDGEFEGDVLSDVDEESENLL